MKPGGPSGAAHTIPMVTKALRLVRALSVAGEETTTKALAIRLGLPRSSCYRILRSLVAQDWVRPVAEGRHELSPGLLPVLEPLRRLDALAEAVGPAMGALANRTQLTVKVTVRQGDEAVTIARCESPRGTSVGVRVGAAFHLTLGSSGSVLLSGMGAGEVAEILGRAPEGCWQYQDRDDLARRVREVKAKGWCSDQGISQLVFHGVSAPIREAGGRVIAAVTAVGFSHEVTKAMMPGLGRAVVDAARQAEGVLGGAGVARAGNPAPRANPKNIGRSRTTRRRAAGGRR